MPRRLRVVSNFGDRDCGAGEILLEISRARVCISPAQQSRSPKLETTRSLDASKKEGCPILMTCSSRESCDSSGATRTSCTSLEVVREKNELS